LYVFVFIHTSPSDLYTLSLHDALPILRGGAHPLCAVRRHHPRTVRRDLLLVAQDDGAALVRATGQVALLAAVPRHEPGVLSDARSEEHTSELQSRGHLVCRLLLEKKKK